MTPPPGNPILRVRIDPDILPHLERKAEEAAPGTAGGVSAYVRRLIYRDLEADGLLLPAEEPADTQRADFWTCINCGNSCRSVFASCPRCWEKHPEAVQASHRGWSVLRDPQARARHERRIKILLRLVTGLEEHGLRRLTSSPLNSGAGEEPLRVAVWDTDAPADRAAFAVSTLQELEDYIAMKKEARRR